MLKEIRLVALLALVMSALLAIAYQMPGDVFVDLGPNDRMYASGFRPDFENDEPTIIHWTTNRSNLELPLYMRGPFDLTLRYKRHIAAVADVRIYRGGEPVDRFEAPQRDFSLHQTRVQEMGPGLAQIEILSTSDDRRPLGIALDWIQLRAASRKSTILPRWSLWLLIWAWLATAYLVGRMTLGTRHGAVAACLGLGLVMLASVLTHKLWLVHVLGILGSRPLIAIWPAIGLVALKQRNPESVFSGRGAKLALLIVFFASLFRLGLLFHPDFYYPDVRTHSKFVYAIWSEGIGGFLVNHIENQHRHLLGLQLVGGRWLAFPYPPVLYLLVYPLSLIQQPVEEWMTLLLTAVVTSEALLMMALGRRLGLDDRIGAIAAVLHATSRLVAFRLAVASYAALFGHFLDVLVVIFLLAYSGRLNEKKIGLGLSALVFLSMMSYAGSALVLGLFLPFLGLWLFVTGSRDRARAVLIFSALGAFAAILIFYVQYIPELMPRGDESHEMQDMVSLSFTPLAAIGMAAHRLRLFFGLGFAVLLGLLTAGAFVHLRKNKSLHPLTLPLACASLFTFAGLNILRAGLGETHIFQFTKDVLVVLPLACLLLAGFVDRLWQRPRWIGRTVAILMVAAWVGFGIYGFTTDIRGRFIRPDYPPAPFEPKESARLSN